MKAMTKHRAHSAKTVYEAGQSFSDLPGDRHRVSANASETKPAKLGTLSRVSNIL
jgi:hypothetical protein